MNQRSAGEHLQGRMCTVCVVQALGWSLAQIWPKPASRFLTAPNTAQEIKPITPRRESGYGHPFFSESTVCTQAFPWHLASKPGNGTIMYWHRWDCTLHDETWEKNDVLNGKFRRSSYATNSDFVVNTYIFDILLKNLISGNKWFKYLILTGFLIFIFTFILIFILIFIILWRECYIEQLYTETLINPSITFLEKISTMLELNKLTQYWPYTALLTQERGFLSQRSICSLASLFTESLQAKATGTVLNSFC